MNALLQVYNATGAVLHGYGAVLIHDVSLVSAASSQNQTNEVPSSVEVAAAVGWPSTSGKLYKVQSARQSISGDGVRSEVVDLVRTNQQRLYPKRGSLTTENAENPKRNRRFGKRARSPGG